MCLLICKLFFALFHSLQGLLLHLLFDQPLPLDGLVQYVLRLLSARLNLLAHADSSTSSISRQTPGQNLLALDVPARHAEPRSLGAIWLISPLFSQQSLRRVWPRWTLATPAKLIEVIHISSTGIETQGDVALAIGGGQA